MSDPFEIIAKADVSKLGAFVAAFTGFFALAWKWLRQDRRESREARAEERVDKVYSHILEQLQTDVKELRGTCTQLIHELSACHSMHDECRRANSELQLRVERLECKQ